MERDFGKRAQVVSRERRKAMIEPCHPNLNLSRQCHLLCVSRSSLYDRPKGESAENLALMRRIDELFLEYSFQSELVRQSREGERIGRARADGRRCCIHTACDVLMVMAVTERKQRNFKGFDVSCLFVSRNSLAGM